MKTKKTALFYSPDLPGIFVWTTPDRITQMNKFLRKRGPVLDRKTKRQKLPL